MRPGEPSVAVLVEERLERLADAGASVPVDDLRGRSRQGFVGIGAASERVTRVRRVPKQKASTRRPERSAPCANITSARE